MYNKIFILNEGYFVKRMKKTLLICFLLMIDKSLYIDVENFGKDIIKVI